MAQKLTLEEKQGIQRMLLDYAARYASQAKAANSLHGVTSPGTFNAVVNGKFERISDEMFLRIKAAVGSGKSEGWQICQTSAFKDVETLLADAQQYQNVSWIVAPAGIGRQRRRSSIQRHTRMCLSLVALRTCTRLTSWKSSQRR